MASITERITKDGRRTYRIRYRLAHGMPEHSKTWVPPESWSDKMIERELPKIAAAFERQCRNGNHQTRAEAKQAQLEEQQKNEKILTVSQYCARVFMPNKQLACTPNTIESFKANLRLHIEPFIGSIPMSEVGVADLSAILLQMQHTGFAHASVSKVYMLLSLIFKSAYMLDMIQANPMDRVQKPKQSKDEKAISEPEAYNTQELQSLIDFMRAEPLQWRVMVLLLIYTGCRKGEASSLQWQDVDFDAATITIARSLNYTKTEGIYTGTPKNGHTRVVDIPADLVQLLREHRKDQATRAISQWVFSQRNGEAIHPQSIVRYLHKVEQRTGLNHLHAHKLRHSFASLAIQSGADILSVSEILGHSDTSTTLRIYSHASQESKKRASNIFQNALSSYNKGEETAGQ
ncbi:MAG: site-specific integrase [Clostridia bacterium]|nr:site-specific integrase [Clostridia bacterium]